MLASKIAYSARNSTGRIYPRSLVSVCSYCRDPGNIYLRNPEYWNSEFSSRNTIGIRNTSSFDKESAILFLESKTVLYDKSARWPAEYHKTWGVVMPATNLRLLKKLLLQRFHLKIGLPVLQVKGLTRMAVYGEGLQSKVTLNDGYKMPLFGLGVFKALGDDGKEAVKFALQNGYRMIDTAALYG